ncbi:MULTISPECIES: ATP-binding protein [Aneurinibacillus]|uniref:ATP-binding protein n=1 Tax=Aneurinibacillus TaxID=55079 RepID=UPI000FB2D1C0|nr:ATP-binding protein [Aneurinibacillus migulanus]
MDIHVPSQFNRHSMYTLINRVIDADKLPRDEKFIFDFRTLSFIEPVGITVLSNLIQWLFRRNIQVGVRYNEAEIHNRRSPIKYLDDSMFFQHYAGKTFNPNASLRETTLPLEHVAYNRSYQWIQDKFITWLSYRLNLSRASFDNIKICMEEIFNNINDHAQENIGCVFAQEYPNINEIRVAISDFGVGIPYNVQQQLPFLDDCEAILEATNEGFTTKSTPGNRGAGLDTLIRNVVNNNQGSIHIHSNHGIVSFTHGYDGICVDKKQSDSFYPGTLLEIVLRTDTIPQIEEQEEEFEWL